MKKKAYSNIKQPNMNIIHTYWSKPSLSEVGNHSFPWLSEKFHALSWAFSMLRIKQMGHKIILYTDEKGYKWLIDDLKLPYDDIVIELDNLGIPTNLWSLAKIWVFAQQKEPFIHIDGDVFIWDDSELKNTIEPNHILCQHIEDGYPYYENYFHTLTTEKFILPSYFPLENETFVNKALNCGVIGGNNPELFAELWNTAFSLYSDNKEKTKNLPYGVNTLFEQYLINSIAERYNAKIHTFLKHDVRFDDDYLPDFQLVPFGKKYVHLSTNAKREPKVLKELENRLSYEFPDYYGYINSYYKEYSITKSSQTKIEDVDRPHLSNAFSRISKQKEVLKDIYTYIYSENFTLDDFLRRSFVLSDNFTIIETSKPYSGVIKPDFELIEIPNQQKEETITEHLIYPLDNNIYIQQVKDWNILIPCFEEPITGFELIEIVEQANLIPPDKRHTIKDLVAFFLLSKTLFFQELRIH
ncbi:MAG: hypothetical protein QM654_09255 [Dysgonamonadaceae bacterium]